MVDIVHSQQSIGKNYPENTGRHKKVKNQSEQVKKVALIGDSTLDNGYWVQKNKPYAEKTATVTHQTAVSLAKKANDQSYDIANFAVDGARTYDIDKEIRLNMAFRGWKDEHIDADEDHLKDEIVQTHSVYEWAPDVVVLSVGGNNYRVPLQTTLYKHLNPFQLLTRQTTDDAKTKIKEIFDEVKAGLLEDYKSLLDGLDDELRVKKGTQRVVLLSQYYPELTELTYYFIYTGFSHVARSQGLEQTAFTAMQDTMNELYRQILSHAATKGIEVVFVDITSSINPLGNRHSHQIEPNHRGARLMGRLIAEAVEYQFPEKLDSDEKVIPVIQYNENSRSFQTRLFNQQQCETFSVKPLQAFISEGRYKHIGHFFRPESSLTTRFESAYHMIKGKQFDAQYTGLHAFGLLDASLITVVANYLWRVALEQDNNAVLRAGAAIVSAPVLLVEQIVSISLLLVLGLPISLYHLIAKSFVKHEEPSHSEAIVKAPVEKDSIPEVLVLGPGDEDDSDSDLDDGSKITLV